MAGNLKITGIDGDGLILGRAATHIAKLLLSGETVVMINAEKVIISGGKRSIINSKKESMKIITHATPWRGPFHYRTPDRIIRRAIRGMLPWKKSRGREAYRRLHIYVGRPKELEGQTFMTISNAKLTDINKPHMTVGNLSQELSWRE
jgi:large subunit ribosomal protein L13